MNKIMFGMLYGIILLIAYLFIKCLINKNILCAIIFGIVGLFSLSFARGIKWKHSWLNY